MSLKESTRTYIIQWNNQFPLDRVYRKKYNIAFGSEAHRQMCQIDIYYDWLEDQVYSEYQEDLKEMSKKEDEYKKGIWISPRENKMTEAEQLDLFDKLDVLNF